MRVWLTLALLGLIAAHPASAQPAPAPVPAVSVQQSPPSRVGAVTHISGSLVFHGPSDTQWSAAATNYPFAAGGSFYTDEQARAQIQIGPTTLSMDSATEIDVTNLNEEVAQLSLPQGRIHLRLRQLGPGQSFEIDLPQGAVWLLRPGSYDIDAGNPKQDARIAVFAGNARFGGSGADISLKAGEAIVLSQTNPVTVTSIRAGSDAFVEWCTAHDYREDRVVETTHYISPHMTGYADLGGYGDWRSSPQYGEVWYPSQVPADWAPYRDGRWIWVAPWGWTWVDQQPWGFAPFHYGRWAYIDNRWGWVPGEYVAQPVYAPALVAFVSLGAAEIGAAAAAGRAVGWFPLAPGEVYWPSYTRNTTYIRNINIANVKNINTAIVESHDGAPPPQVVNANFANHSAATVVPQRVFASADLVAPAVVQVPPAELQKAPVALRPPRVTPVVAKAPAAGSRVPPTAPATTSTAALPPHPGALVTVHPRAPGTSPETAALPLHPGEVGSGGRATPRLPPPIEHGGAPTAHPGAAGPVNAAALPPPSGVAALHRLPPSPANAALPAAPNAAKPEHVSNAESARREVPSANQPERRLPPAAAIHPAPTPHPAAPASHPPAEAQVVHPVVVHPSPPVRHPAAVVVPPRPEPLATHSLTAPSHPAGPPAHPVQPAAAHPPPAPGGKPVPKEKGKQEEAH